MSDVDCNVAFMYFSIDSIMHILNYNANGIVKIDKLKLDGTL